jgi:hypothetical protein
MIVIAIRLQAEKQFFSNKEIASLASSLAMTV